MAISKTADVMGEQVVCVTCEKPRPVRQFRKYGSQAGECDVCHYKLRDFRRYEKLFEEPITPKQLSRLCSNLAHDMLLEGINYKKIKDAKLSEVVRSADTLFSISQTLEGRPTRIISYKDRQSRSELLKAMTEELMRRSMTIDVTATVVEEEESSGGDVV